MFVDSVTLTLSAGSGGNGAVAWRREKYIPKGGPFGGNGGKGGDIILEADTGMHSLEAFRHRRIIRAENGKAGASGLKKGHSGSNLILKVPYGTLVKDVHTQEILFDFTEKQNRFVICVGGRGGKGNACFKSSTHQAPNFATPGLPGESCEIELELKLIADVGLVGLPNAGKSTLLTKITHAKVKIAPYPFTTLHPNLSYIQCEDFSRILIADIPGIIENAHINKGLGLSFLKHIERTSVLLYVIDISGQEERDPFHDFEILRNELKAYNEEMLGKPFLVALNKMDREEAKEQAELFKKKYPFPPSTLIEISALNQTGISTLIETLRQIVNSSRSLIKSSNVELVLL